MKHPRPSKRLAIHLAACAAIHTSACLAQSVELSETNPIDSSVMSGGTGDPVGWHPKVHFGVTAGAMFEDNVFISGSNKVSDTILVASGRVTVAFGNVQSWAARFIDTSSRALLAASEEGGENLVAVTYSPMAQFFTDHGSLNTVDHDVAATVRWSFTKLELALDGRFQTLSDPDPDLGGRVDRVITNGHFQAHYQWTEKTSVEAGLDFQNRDYDRGQDSTEYQVDSFALFQVLPKTSVGIGLAGGQLDLDGGDSQSFEQALLRLRYDSFSKVVVSATAGGELRQRGDGDDETNGVFQIGLSYYPAENTQVYLSAYRRTEPSARGDSQSIERTSVAIGLDQRLFQKILLSANADYGIADYNETENDRSRTDNLFNFSATMTFEITQNGFVRLGYTYQKNDSDISGLSYDANRVSLSVTALF